MKTVMQLLTAHPGVSDFKINVHKKESYELFFVKGKLETVRCTDTCDKVVSVYSSHDGFLGDAQFFIYPSTTADQLKDLIQEAVDKALLINNQSYTLPGAETGTYTVESNFGSCDFSTLAAQVANAVAQADAASDSNLNAVEIFLYRHTETVLNSRGLEKTQVRYDAMLEAIPTFNGETQSVELYEQYNFSSFDPDIVTEEIALKLREVEARYAATVPTEELSCPVILNKLELSELFSSIADDLNFATVYSKSNVHSKGDAIQKSPLHDRIGIVMAGEVPGSVRSRKFDGDGISLGSIRVVENGLATNYYGSNRFGQYLGETPTGNLDCVLVDPGSAKEADFAAGPYLEVVSMSGLQVDFYTDYIGGEVRLAYYHNGQTVLPVTGISISGNLSQVLDHIHLSEKTAVFDGYFGPDKAIIDNMKIF